MIPLQLDRVIQVLPGTYSTKVYLLLVKLGWSTVIEASAPTSHGISNAFDKASAFADPFSVVAESMDIKAAYDNKNGAPSAGRPKIFMRYFYVNAVTGEKSADILKEVELGENNDPYDEGNQG